MTLGEKLKKQRQQRGYTQMQLAAEAGISQGLIARIERNQVKDPSSGVLRRTARVLGCSIDWLVGLYDDEPMPVSSPAVVHAPPSQRSSPWVNYQP